MFRHLGDVAQLARAPALQAGGRGFESHRLHHNLNCYGRGLDFSARLH